MVPMVVDDLVIAGFANGRLVAFQLLTGEIQWALRLSNPRGANDIQRLVDVDAQPVLVNGRLYAAGYEGILAAIQPTTGEVSWQQPSSVVASLTTDGRSLYVADYRGDIIAYALPSMAVRWRNQQYGGRPITALNATSEGLVMTDRQGHIHLLDFETGDTQGRFSMVGSQTFSVAAQPHAHGFVVQSVQGLVFSGQHRPMWQQP
jgi:outer membrane protein assembly factor BamB